MLSGLCRTSFVVSPICPPAANLVDVDGHDDRCADDDLLPEGLDSFDDEAVLENGRNERADCAAENGAHTAEETRPADDDGADRAEVVRLVRDRRRVRKDRQVEDGRDAGEQPGECVHLDDVTVDRNAGTSRAFFIRPDRRRVAAEARVVEDDMRDDEKDDRDIDWRGQPKDLPIPEVGGKGRRNRGREVGAAADQVTEAEGHPERAERHDEGRQAQLRDERPVDQSPGSTREDADGDSHRNREARVRVVAVDRLLTGSREMDHHLAAGDGTEEQDAADREVDPCGDDDERLTDREQDHLGRVQRDLLEVRPGEERPPGGRKPEVADQRDQEEEEPRASECFRRAIARRPFSDLQGPLPLGLRGHGFGSPFGAGGRHLITSTEPVSSPGPAAYGTSSELPRERVNVPPSVSSLPSPSTTTRIENAGSRDTAGAGRSCSALKKEPAAAGRSVRAPGRDSGAAAVRPFSSASSSPCKAARRALCRATSKPRPRWPSRRPSMSKPVHSSSTERSEGSWSSRRKTPSPIACGRPAGTKKQSPRRTVSSLSASSMAARS